MSSRGFLGVDTSNYTTSTALFAVEVVLQQRRLLPVAKGAAGLRQSDAVFAHTKALGVLLEQLFAEFSGTVAGIGVSCAPRRVQDSYMPCFLSGVLVAQSLSAAMKVPLYRFSHQEGHLAAALFGAKRLDLLDQPFVAFHLSGGTTECLLCENLLQGRVRLLSETNDLNAGQLVDRVGLLLGLSFPCGPQLDTLAQQSSQRYTCKVTLRNGNPCLSGVENQCAAMHQKGAAACDVARFCLDSILAALVPMVQNAIAATGLTTVVFAGGVMSNAILRPCLEARFQGIFAPPQLSTDNAVGVATLSSICHERGVNLQWL